MPRYISRLVFVSFSAIFYTFFNVSCYCIGGQDWQDKITLHYIYSGKAASFASLSYSYQKFSISILFSWFLFLVELGHQLHCLSLIFVSSYSLECFTANHYMLSSQQIIKHYSDTWHTFFFFSYWAMMSMSLFLNSQAFCTEAVQRLASAVSSQARGSTWRLPALPNSMASSTSQMPNLEE